MTWSSGLIGVCAAFVLVSACGSTDEPKCAEPPCIDEPVTFSVVTPDGTSVPDATVTVTDCDGGDCAVSDISPGNHTLHVSAPGYQAADVAVTAAYSDPEKDCTCHFLRVMPASVTLMPLTAQ